MSFSTFLAATFFALLANADTTTRTDIVSVYSTTTIRLSGSPASSASSFENCNNFVGACVVYGGGGHAYTTTVYVNVDGPGGPHPPPPAPPPPPSTLSDSTVVVTSTTTVPQTITASDTAGCEGFSGACVIYGTGDDGSYSTTLFAGSGEGGGPAASSAAAAAPGPNDNGDGVLGQDGGDGGDGVIGQPGSGGGGQLGSATRLNLWTATLVVMLGALGFAILL
jgi:hypothetical protein